VRADADRLMRLQNFCLRGLPMVWRFMAIELRLSLVMDHCVRRWHPGHIASTHPAGPSAVEDSAAVGSGRPDGRRCDDAIGRTKARRIVPALFRRAPYHARSDCGSARSAPCASGLAR
jgi:hypothetical protein